MKNKRRKVTSAGTGNRLVEARGHTKRSVGIKVIKEGIYSLVKTKISPVRLLKDHDN